MCKPMEIELITIEDSDEEEVIEDSDEEEVIEDSDEEELIIIDDDDEDMDVETTTLADSDYESVNDSDREDDNERCVQVLNTATLRANNEERVMCDITFYVEADGFKYCTECFLKINDFIEANAVRKHKTERFVYLAKTYCFNCNAALHQMLPCDICPICVS